MSWMKKLNGFAGANPHTPEKLEVPHFIDYGSRTDWELLKSRPNSSSDRRNFGVMLPIKGRDEVMHVEIVEDGFIRIHTKPNHAFSSWKYAFEINIMEEIEMSKLAK